MTNTTPTPLEQARQRVLLMERIETLCEALTANYLAQYGNKPYTPEPQRFGVDPDDRGRRFVRIVMGRGERDGSWTGRSVHAFVEIATGDLYKAEGWKKPAKHVRGNLLDDVAFQAILDRCDWAGGYLYLR